MYLEALRTYAQEIDEPLVNSGQKEVLENHINRFI
jgi:xylose isomerase